MKTGDYRGEIFSVDRHSGQIIWHTNGNVLSNFALSKKSLYYLTTGGYFLGLNPTSGQQEAFVKLLPEEFYHPQVGSISFQVAYDDLTQNILLLLGDSAQLIAFKNSD